MSVTATARVVVTLELALTDSWGDDCSIAQVNKQARDSVEGMLRNNHVHELARARIIGDVHVQAIIAERK